MKTWLFHILSNVINSMKRRRPLKLLDLPFQELQIVTAPEDPVEQFEFLDARADVLCTLDAMPDKWWRIIGAGIATDWRPKDMITYLNMPPSTFFFQWDAFRSFWTKYANPELWLRASVLASFLSSLKEPTIDAHNFLDLLILHTAKRIHGCGSFDDGQFRMYRILRVAQQARQNADRSTFHESDFEIMFNDPASLAKAKAHHLDVLATAALRAVGNSYFNIHRNLTVEFNVIFEFEDLLYRRFDVSVDAYSVPILPKEEMRGSHLTKLEGPNQAPAFAPLNQIDAALREHFRHTDPAGRTVGEGSKELNSFFFRQVLDGCIQELSLNSDPGPGLSSETLGRMANRSF